MKIRLTALALASAASLLSGCIVVPAHRGTVYGGAPAPVYTPGPAYPQAQGYPPAPVYSPAPVVVAPMAPPPMQVEVVPAMPFAGAIWIGGYWNWMSNRHVWTPGRWDHPRPGYRWEPQRWEPQGGGWHLRGGWRDAR